MLKWKKSALGSAMKRALAVSAMLNLACATAAYAVGLPVISPPRGMAGTSTDWIGVMGGYLGNGIGMGGVLIMAGSGLLAAIGVSYKLYEYKNGRATLGDVGTMAVACGAVVGVVLFFVSTGTAVMPSASAITGTGG